MRRFAVIAVLVLVAGTGLVGCTREPGPDQALRAFLDGWRSGDLSAVALEDPDGAALVPADVTKQIESLAGDLVATKATPNPAGDVEESDGTATAPVTVEWTVADGLVWSYQTTVRMRKVEQNWRVVFAPDTVHPQLKADDHLSARPIPADRGSILDGAGEAIVKQRPVVNVGVEPQRITNQGALIAALDAAFKSIGVSVDLADLPARIAAGNPDAFISVVTLRREAYDQIRDKVHDLAGTVFEEGTLALAPTRTFARALLGTVGDVTREQLDANPGKYLAGELIGQSGLQKQYDDLLRGTPGVQIVIPQPRGADGSGDADIIAFRSEPAPGETLKITLDQKVQNAADTALVATPQRSALVAIRVSDGAILAAANGPAGGELNLAFTASVPPGSTFKMVTTLSLLEAGHVTPDTTVDCPKTFTVDGRTFTNAGGFELGAVPFHVDFARSCNTAFASLAPKLGGDGLSKAAASLGIGTTWNLGTEVFTGSVATNASTVEAAAAAFGQGQTLVSPVCLGAAVAAVARGSWVQPVLLPTVPEAAPAPAAGPAGNPPANGTALKPESVASLRAMMREVVTAGTATALLDVPGSPVQVKTGTAEFNNNPADTHAWTIGWQGDIAFAVFVEQGGSSAATAVPIVEQFLRALA